MHLSIFRLSVFVRKKKGEGEDGLCFYISMLQSSNSPLEYSISKIVGLTKYEYINFNRKVYISKYQLELPERLWPSVLYMTSGRCDGYIGKASCSLPYPPCKEHPGSIKGSKSRSTDILHY